MNQPELTPAALQERGLDMVRVLWSDMHGVPRGKDVTADAFGQVVDHGIAFCQALMMTDLSATPLLVPETAGTGWPDAVAYPDLSTLRPLTYAPGYAVCLADLREAESSETLPFSPRDILRRQVQRAHSVGLYPVMGPEFEFYLCEPDPTAAHGWSPVVTRESAGYVVGVSHDPANSLTTIFRQCRDLGLGVYAANQEFSGGQFEINQHHSDILDAADRAFLFKYAVKEVAALHSVRATFMGKPFNDRSGSGMHLHLSMRDAGGISLFDDKSADHGLSQVATNFVAGVLRHASAATALLNPGVNAFKRLRDEGALVPQWANWGLDNRTAFARIPSERGPAARVEIRAGDGTANPYLAAAVLLAAGLNGVEEGLQLGEPTRGSAGSGTALPASFSAALNALQADERIVDAMGDRFVSMFVALKRQEIDRFERTVTDWEFEEYSWML